MFFLAFELSFTWMITFASRGHVSRDDVSLLGPLLLTTDRTPWGTVGAILASKPTLRRTPKQHCGSGGQPDQGERAYQDLSQPRP